MEFYRKKFSTKRQRYTCKVKEAYPHCLTALDDDLILTVRSDGVAAPDSTRKEPAQVRERNGDC